MLIETAAAFCRNCKKPTMHRYSAGDLCCNECHTIAVTFHEPVSISRDADKQPNQEKEVTGPKYCKKCGNKLHHLKTKDDDTCWQCQTEAKDTERKTEIPGKTYPVRCRVCHKVVGRGVEASMTTCSTCKEANDHNTYNPLDILRSFPARSILAYLAYQYERLEQELKTAKANQCDGTGSVDLAGTTIAGGIQCVYCSKCQRWREKVCA